MIAVLDLFSAAAGGWSLGLHRAGFRTVAACEVVPWRRALYSENNPGVKVYDDVQTLTADRLRADLGGMPDIIVGSPPCQDISSANTKGKGVEGDRSSLYFDAVRLVGECRPRWFAFENSSNLRTRGADAVLAALEGIGYTCWPVVVRAGDVGANHERPRCWLIGCDLSQVADADGFGRDEGRGGRWSGIDLSISEDIGDAEEDGRRSRLSRRRAGAAAGAEQPPCGDASYPDSDGQLLGALDAEMGELPPLGDHRGGYAAADAPGLGYVARPGDDESSRPEADGNESADDASSGSAGRNTPHPDQARQAHGCMEPGLRQEEIAHDGRGPGRRDDKPGTGQMAVCPSDRSDVRCGGPEWSLNDLADHLRLDDGLSAWLAGTRVALGDGKGQSAASLVVEAFGDAVIPQIPEAIGRAILRTEAALALIYGRSAA